jgi:hypothetical protein
VSKCDFRIDLAGRMVSLPPDTLSQFRFNLALPRSLSTQISSSKCDWSVAVGSLQTKGSGDRLRDLQSDLGTARLRATSDKCDWSVRVDPARADLRQPALDARVAASKCDFSVRVQVGTKGASLRLGAASAKCDFRIDQVEILDAGTQRWRTLDLRGGGGGVKGGGGAKKTPRKPAR